MKTDHLLFGAAYYSEYLPYDRVEKDMEMMEKAGMNTIRIAESTWSTTEPKDGIFDFTHLDKMLEAAGTPPYFCHCRDTDLRHPGMAGKKIPGYSGFDQ